MKHIAAVLTTVLLAATGAEAKPLKVFILAGQSNMEGPANISTFDYIGDDPATAPMLTMMRDADGKPAVCDGAWISYLTGGGDENYVIKGQLTAGYGSMWGQDPTKPGDKIGPEFTFGLTVDAALDEPVLIIKAAWGGKSLHTDFRSPSAGPYELSSFQRENYPKQTGHGIPQDFEQWKADKAKATGHYYPYYPSTEHFCKPAQGREDFIDCVNLDGWTVDFISARRLGLGKYKVGETEQGYNSRFGIRWFMNRQFRLALLRDWETTSPETVIDFTRYDRPAHEPQDLGRNWSLLGRINQKQTRPQDQPGPLAALPEDDRALIRSVIPDLGA